MTRGGKKVERDGAERRCIATGDSLPIAGMIRFVCDPEDRVVPDLAHRLPGRGIWVQANRAHLEKAIQKGLFSRAARKTVVADDEMVVRVEQGLANRVVDFLSLARKAGLAVAGFEKVKAKVAEGSVQAVLSAIDGSDREKERLHGRRDGLIRISALTSDEMGLAFGRERVIHAALGGGGLTNRFLVEAARLRGMRDTGNGVGPSAV